MANISISGGTSPTVAVYGKNSLISVGLGSDSVGANATVGNLTGVSVSIHAANAAMRLGNDTINAGSGLDTVVQSGQATVTSAFSSVTGGGTLSGITSGLKSQVATVIGGALHTSSGGLLNNVLTDVQGILGGVTQTGGVTVSNALLDVQGVAQGPPSILAATLNNAGIDVQTLLGNTLQTGGVTASNALQDVQGVAQGPPQILAATLSNTLQSVAGVAQGPPAILGATSQNLVAEIGGAFSGLKSTIHSTVGTGADSLTGGSSQVSNFLSSEGVAQSAITNFVSANPMSVDGYSLSYLQAHHDISSQGGNTVISIDGGKSSIELKGISGLTNSESVLHKN